MPWHTSYENSIDFENHRLHVNVKLLPTPSDDRERVTISNISINSFHSMLKRNGRKKSLAVFQLMNVTAFEEIKVMRRVRLPYFHNK